jgi:hypothetical protein
MQAGPAAVAEAAHVQALMQPGEQQQQLQPHVTDTAVAAGMPGVSGAESFSAGGRSMELLQFDKDSSGTSDDHHSENRSSSDSDEAADAVSAMQQRNSRIQLPVVAQPEGVWRVGGTVRDC